MKILLFLLPLLVFSKEVSLDFISNKPKSIAKDYYIWRFLDQNITEEEAKKAFYQVKNINRKIFLRYAKKSSNKAIKKIAYCMRLKSKDLVDKDGECIAVGMSLYKFVSLDDKDRKIVLKKVKKYKNLYRKFYILSSKNPFFILLNNEELFIDIFNSVGSRYKKEYLNQTIPKDFLEKLKNINGFDTFVNISITNPNLNLLHFSFFDISTKNLSANSSFLIAINAIRYKKYDIAKKFLKYSYEKSYFTFDKDKALFWIYQLTEDKKILKKLSNSNDINIYSIYAKEKLHKKIENFIVYDFKNFKKSIDIKDPFVWLEILKKIESKKNEELLEFANSFKSKDLLPIYSFIMERYFRYKIHPFITPYKDILKDLDKKDKILIYSLARQESRFIPSSISSSFALGTMQIMPFLANAIAKDRNFKNFDLDMMFDPKINIDFSIYHLNFLKKRLSHPLLIAYAYNGGIGFLKREVIDKKIFNYEKFEPFLGMELIPYPESRRYGKKVLANYVIYSKILGNSENLKTLIKKLELFDHNHHF